MLNFDEDFKNYNPADGMDVKAGYLNRLNLEDLGIDPAAGDDVFGAKFIYCGAHHRAHSSGWCTVRLALKRPLNAETEQDAKAEAKALGFPLV
jgi:hypothetical protein